QHLAVAGNEGSLTIHDSQGKLLETIPLNDEGSDITDINAVRFANKSRYVMYGGSDKIVNIWDRKESTFTESLKGHRSTITCIDLNVDETIVASSSISGQILVHNRQKSNAWDNLTVLTKQSINVLEYSFFKRGLLAAGGEDGSLRLWDTCVSSTALQTFESAHYSEIKGIAFSPFNSHLMCSGGLDKRIVLYDVGKKTTLKSIHTDTPLTALGFKADGVTEKDRSTDRRNTIVKKQSHFKTSSRGSTPPISNKISRPSPPPQTPNDTKEKNYMDMFSPVREEINTTELITDFSSKISRPSPQTQTPNDTKEKNDMDIFSPVREEGNGNTTMEITSDFLSKISRHSPPPPAQTPNDTREKTDMDMFSPVREEINGNTTMEVTSDFPLQVIRNAVDECLQEFRTSLRNDIQNMHLELLRQFHIQKTEMEMMFLKYCGETLSLREE
ncbi:12941_t:CDS:2, partial [Cetraspora pellucida]